MIFIIVTDFGINVESENDNIFRASSCEVIQQQRLFHDMAYDYNNTVNKITLVPKKTGKTGNNNPFWHEDLL